MSLEILWFVLIAFLWTGFFFLEGFDFGVSILQFFLGKNEKERGTYISSITPHWDGNEVWLLTAGGATFAAFPLWYAAFFSALYLPLVFLLLALITRGACFEFRHRSTLVESRSVCDVVLVISSSLAGLLTSVAMANLVLGIPVDSNGNFAGNFFDLVRPFALFGGVLGLSLFIVNGALFLTLKIEGELQERALRFLRPAIIICTVLFAAASVLIWKHTFICVFPLALLLTATVLVFMQHLKTAFALIAVCTACCVASLFFTIFPNVLVSSISIENNLTVWNAASSDYTLKIMSIVALIFIPAVITYQIWSYYVFRKRISPRNANIEV
ncbi:MAG: cytochrome d ubiquinol oxidase subunit II [Candidatus Fibromonas sp.]|jgi:cytochrome d ubiquinol oxidase subunit II|nr:cytochrome d ubiquinol oxidase subunit II [Candidatus Fibromonas sp.]